MRLAALLLCFAPSLLATTCNASTSVLTERMDIARTGVQANETVLTQANVSGPNFHGVAVYATTDNVWAQPLVCDTGAKRLLVIYDAAANVYVYDAAATGSPSPIWQASMGTPYGGLSVCNGDFGPLNNCGGVPTPVIDGSNGVLYVEAHLSDASHHLYALNIADGTTVHASVTIDATVAGVLFSSTGSQERARNGLMLTPDGNVLVSYASTADNVVLGWYGWAHKFDKATLARTASYCNTCGVAGIGAGFWGGISSDGTDFFMTSGNALNGVTPYPANFNPGVSRLSGSTLAQLDWWAPVDYISLSEGDFDMTSNIIFWPTTTPTYVIAAGKKGRIVLLHKTDLGHLEGGGGTAYVQSWTSDYVGQVLKYDMLATTDGLYVASSGQIVGLYPWNGSLFTGLTTTFAGVLNPPTMSTVSFFFSGGQLGYSWNGATSATKILWAMGASAGGYTAHAGYLCALHATTLATLWCSNNSNIPVDSLGNSPKFSTMAISGGRVFAATRSQKVVAYGLVSPTQAAQ